MSLVRCLQTCTAAAALFAILGACGLPPPGRPARVTVRPRPPRAEVTVRSLTGTWAALWRTPEGVQTLTLSMVQSGDALAGALFVEGRVSRTDPANPARLSVLGRFTLQLGHPREIVVIAGRPDATGDRISASVSGLSAERVALTFRRR